MGDLIFPILLLLATTVFLASVFVFFVWVALYFGRKAYRRRTRRHLYVPVVAKVNRIWPHREAATLYVEYDVDGVKIVNRFVTTRSVAQLADQSREVAIMVDPDYPKDVMVHPEFERQAASTPGLLEPMSRSWYARLCFLSVLAANILGAVCLWWLSFADEETIDLWLMWTLVASVIFLCVIGYLFHSLHDAARKRKQAVALEGEDDDGRTE